MNQKSLDKKKTSELFEGVNSTLHQSFVGAVEREKEPKKLSDCCNAEVATANSGLAGETNYYICTKCHNDCDVIAEPKELEWEIIRGNLMSMFRWQDIPERFYLYEKTPEELCDFIKQLLTQQRTEIFKDLIEIADKGELEELRREVTIYFKGKDEN